MWGTSRTERDAMLIKLWGVRGSTPTPQPENMRYGGNTPCVEVRLNGHVYIFDCGTGFRNLGKSLAQEFAGRRLEAHIFLSHFHWDHIQGIPFFLPLYGGPENCFTFHSSKGRNSLRESLEGQMVDPYFPVEMSHMAASRNFCDLQEGRLELADCVLETRRLNHPQGCVGFRLESEDGVLVYATDNEPGSAEFDSSVRQLAAGADVLIYDAQYLPEEYQARRRGWGHSHWRDAVDVAVDSGTKQLLLFHHDPDHDDECIDRLVAEARTYFPNVDAAAEGMQVQVCRESRVVSCKL
jgi:phosphoribosyl 1,2-cyclic phosphodiesterase